MAAALSAAASNFSDRESVPAERLTPDIRQAFFAGMHWSQK